MSLTISMTALLLVKYHITSDLSLALAAALLSESSRVLYDKGMCQFVLLYTFHTYTIECMPAVSKSKCN